MQREIKFRGLIESQNSGMQNTPTNKWVYGSLVVEPDRCIIQWVEDNRVRAEIVVTESVGQFTGLKDKNGKEICEGDIVTARHPEDEDGDMAKVFAVVIYEAPSFYAKYINDDLNKFISGRTGFILKPQNEIIGNIYENPELLEQQNG